MKNSSPNRAFTLAEVMIALAGSIIILGALLFSSVELQKALYASERYAASQSAQRRLIDYLSRDLRRAVGISQSRLINARASTPLTSAGVLVEDGASLVLTLPGYYQSNARDDDGYDVALPVVVADNRVDYGTEAGHASGVKVIFRREYLAAEKCECFLRIEEGEQTVIVREAKDLHLRVAVGDDGQQCTIDVTYQPTGRMLAGRVSSHDEILLRNIRAD